MRWAVVLGSPASFISASGLDPSTEIRRPAPEPVQVWSRTWKM
ncbi:hypothetical protein Cadr_000012145 [Camelus dromedarius]|uniref:Uncharacterized protein n=1 Tax=Camelus dromedarius TaxID=9838 RepID=A0A5N4DSA7_CAMDR|nr:hypothetical protein Cadr_000012145 [Camelus dromedarius]